MEKSDQSKQLNGLLKGMTPTKLIVKYTKMRIFLIFFIVFYQLPFETVLKSLKLFEKETNQIQV